jgi:type I restriction enzyme R subunit
MYLHQLTAGAVEAGNVTDLYEAAGIPRPDLSHLDEAFIEQMQETCNPHLAIEALRRLVEQEIRKVTRHNIVRQQTFSDRLMALMTSYTNQTLSAAYGYPPDAQPGATELVLRQMETFVEEWSPEAGW